MSPDRGKGPVTTTAGILYIVPGPIGNLKDITSRAVEVLRGVDFVIVEDTRRSLKLLNHLGLKKKMISYYKPKETQKLPAVLDLLKYQRGALLSDSGTPLISDPGGRLVREALKQGIKVIPLPGATAFVPALVSSGLDTQRFLFLGFSPRKEGERRAFLKTLSDLPFTMVFYESPRRLKPFLRDARSVLGDRAFAVAREISKRHESILRGTLACWEQVVPDSEMKGEIVVVIAGAAPRSDPSDTLKFDSLEDIYRYFRETHGIPKNTIKDLVMKRKT